MYQQRSERFSPFLSFYREDMGLLSGNISGAAGKCMAICKGNLFLQCQNHTGCYYLVRVCRIVSLPKKYFKEDDNISFSTFFTSIIRMQ